MQGEAIVIIVLFLDDDWNIQQRLTKIDICEKAVNAEGLAHVPNECLSVDHGIRGNSLLAAMKDGASVNQAAMERIKFIFPKVFSVVCFSNTLVNVGNHFQIPTLREFGHLWIRMFSHSYNVRGFIQQVAAENIAPQIVAEIQDILSDEQRWIKLQLELAAVLDIDEQFVKATYYLEGDGPLVFSCYERLQTVAEAWQAPHFPNVRAVSSAIARENPIEQAAALEQGAKTTVNPAI